MNLIFRFVTIIIWIISTGNVKTDISAKKRETGKQFQKEITKLILLKNRKKDSGNTSLLNSCIWVLLTLYHFLTSIRKSYDQMNVIRNNCMRVTQPFINEKWRRFCRFACRAVPRVGPREQRPKALKLWGHKILSLSTE